MEASTIILYSTSPCLRPHSIPITHSLDEAIADARTFFHIPSSTRVHLEAPIPISGGYHSSVVLTTGTWSSFVEGRKEGVALEVTVVEQPAGQVSQAQGETTVEHAERGQWEETEDEWMGAPEPPSIKEEPIEASNWREEEVALLSTFMPFSSGGGSQDEFNPTSAEAPLRARIQSSCNIKDIQVAFLPQDTTFKLYQAYLQKHSEMHHAENATLNDESGPGFRCNGRSLPFLWLKGTPIPFSQMLVTEWVNMVKARRSGGIIDGGLEDELVFRAAFSIQE